MEYILASASPRRKELLKEVIAEFSVIPSTFDESSVSEGLPPKKLVETLAKGKATEVSVREENAGKTVLGSDTVVAFGKRILGKPRDEREAVEMLRLLSGKKHHVYTGVCFAVTEKGVTRTACAVDKTAVYFERLSDERIKEYVAGGSPMDKAGAYGIQDGGLVKKIKGSYTNVVGLPVERLKKLFEKVTKSNLKGWKV